MPLIGAWRRRLWAAVAGAALLAAMLVTVTVTGPRVSIRWRSDIGPEARLALEARHGLRNGRQDDPQEPLVWRYELGDWSADAVAALVRDEAVTDTNYIDRTTYRVDDPAIVVSTRVPAIVRALPFPFSTDNRFDSLTQLFQLPSACLLTAGGLLLYGARIHDARRRRAQVLAVLLGVGLAGLAVPLPSLRMADSGMYMKNRQNFETTIGRGEVNFENHLTLTLLAKAYPVFGAGEDAPRRTFEFLARAATIWFVLCACLAGIVERWSPHVVRYLALTVLAPSALMYFGHMDFAYLSLNAAAFPLLARGIADGSRRLEAGSALAGLGTAFHAFGLLSLAGAWIASLVVRVPFSVRVDRLLRIAAWGTAAWVGWIAIDMIVLHLGVAQGHAGTGSWRPFFFDAVDRRVNVAIVSWAGARDILVSGCVVGVPLLVVGASLWRRHREDVVLTACYAVPSLLYLVAYWPVQGLGVDTGHVFGTFPAFYAAAWLCAREPRQTSIAAALLVVGQLLFWRMVLDTRFVNWTVAG
jgi:hypothetical protein